MTSRHLGVYGPRRGVAVLQFTPGRGGGPSQYADTAVMVAQATLDL
jgi:hypothetical protein